MSIAQLIDALDKVAASEPSSEAVSRALSRHLGRVATTQVRAVASWAGNLAIARSHVSFASDVLIAFATIGATLVTVPRVGGAKQSVDVAQWSSTNAKRRPCRSTGGHLEESNSAPDLIVQVRLHPQPYTKPKPALRHVAVPTLCIPRTSLGAPPFALCLAHLHRQGINAPLQRSRHRERWIHAFCRP